MYTTEDFIKAEKQERARFTVFLSVSALFVLLIVLSFALRIKLLTIGLTIVWGFFAIFFLSMYYMPVLHYKKTLHLIRDGRKREVKGLIKDIGHDKIIRDNIECTQITVKTGEDRHGDDEVLLYLDSKKQLPAQVGDSLSFTLFDRFICDYHAE